MNPDENSCENSLLDILVKNDEFDHISVENKRVELTEYQKEDRIMGVMVTNILENSIVIKCPEQGRYHQGKQFKICDFLLFNWTKKREVEIFFFELKKTYRGRNVTRAKKQIKGTKSWLQQCVVPQIKEKLKWCKGLDKINEHHVILFEGGRLRKGNTKLKRHFGEYPAEGETDSPWPCSEHNLNRFYGKMNAVSLPQIRNKEKV